MSDSLTRAAILDRVGRAVHAVAEREKGEEYADRLVLAAVLAAGAVAVAWPDNRAAPRFIVRGATVVGAVWKRRSLWAGDATPAP